MASKNSREALQIYRDELHAVVPLSREEEIRLAKEFAKGDERSGEAMIRACLPFVISIALEYRRWGIPLEDIVQQGNVGLLRAARKFDTKKECRLATYAAYWIRAEIRDYVVRAYRVVRLGTTKAERRALRAYRTSSIRDAEGLAKVSGLPLDRVEMLLPILASREASLDASVGDEPSRMERLTSKGASPEEEAADNEFQSAAKAAVKSALETLTEREQIIARRRLMKDDPDTLQELGLELGVSKERVRQIEERLRAKLRDRLKPLEHHVH